MPQDARNQVAETWETQEQGSSHRPMTSQALVPR
jgi:hypothetical protein